MMSHLSYIAHSIWLKFVQQEAISETDNMVKIAGVPADFYFPASGLLIQKNNNHTWAFLW